MGQQISMEDAFPTFQKRCTELFEENMVLRAQIDVLTRQLAAREENAQQPASASGPTGGGPDLAAQPPFPLGDDGS